MRPRTFLAMLLGDRQEPGTALAPITRVPWHSQRGSIQLPSRQDTTGAAAGVGVPNTKQAGEARHRTDKAGVRNHNVQRQQRSSRTDEVNIWLTHRDNSCLGCWLLVMPDGGRKAGMRVFIQFCFWTLTLPILRTLPGNPLGGRLRILRSTGRYGTFKSPLLGRERKASAWSRLFVPSL